MFDCSPPNYRHFRSPPQSLASMRRISQSRLISLFQDRSSILLNLLSPLQQDPVSRGPTKPSSIDTGSANHVLKATSSKVRSGGKAVKMRPSATTNGRNLCALYWLKNDEFRIYYGALTPDQHKQYEDEATQLVANNSWSSGNSTRPHSTVLHA
ncbi:hypothetical protein M405DRAFT_938003 [Rhizopogon salebrosus TDB-379]|nr:hypothetical protein M405DRAFT_938003 [Rhizopogon salebrosus TDB-379]